ncbi:MAG: nucleoside triphosphate pyrophosphatase [Geminicoccaceae bacterium]
MSILAATDGPPVILASGSRARAALLTAAGVPFTTVPALVDEAGLRDALQAEGVRAEDAAVALAEMKAAHVAARAPETAIVLGSDQLLDLDGDWLEKPLDRVAARAQLECLRGRRHRLISAVVAFHGGNRVWHHVDDAALTVRPFSDAFLATYLDAAGDAVLSSVGAYHLEGLGAQLMARVDGAQATVLGMPLLPLLQFLRDQGVLLS